MSHRWFLFPLLVLWLATAAVAHAFAQSYTWGSFDATAAAVGFYTANGQTPLAEDNAVQLIWVGPDNTLNPPDPYTGLPSGDDQLLAIGAIVTNSQVPPPFRNKGYVAQTLYTYDSGDAWAGKALYMRGWNAATIGRQGGATAYGDSPPFTLVDGGIANPLGVVVNQQVSAVALAHTLAQGSPSHTAVVPLLFAMLLLWTAVLGRRLLLSTP